MTQPIHGDPTLHDGYTEVDIQSEEICLRGWRGFLLYKSSGYDNPSSEVPCKKVDIERHLDSLAPSCKDWEKGSGSRDNQNNEER